jgi:hypothetical protein
MTLSPEELTRGMNYRARWKCRECGRTFHAGVKHRTSKSTGPTGCKGCLDLVATETHNLKKFCDERTSHPPLVRMCRGGAGGAGWSGAP